MYFQYSERQRQEGSRLQMRKENVYVWIWVLAVVEKPSEARLCLKCAQKWRMSYELKILSLAIYYCQQKQTFRSDDKQSMAQSARSVICFLVSNLVRFLCLASSSSNWLSNSSLATFLPCVLKTSNGVGFAFQPIAISTPFFTGFKNLLITFWLSFCPASKSYQYFRLSSGFSCSCLIVNLVLRSYYANKAVLDSVVLWTLIKLAGEYSAFPILSLLGFRRFSFFLARVSFRYLSKAGKPVLTTSRATS